MIDHDNLDDFRDPETYDLECDSFAEDRPFMEQWARSIDGPLLDLACGTGRMAIHLALLGHEITGVDVVPEMIARALQKAAERAVSIEWVVADARTFRLGKQFPGIYMLMNAFQFLLTREDQEAMLARVREHLHPEGCFLFETRNPSPRNLFEVRNSEPQVYTTPDGGQLVVTEQQYYDPITQIQHYTSPHRWLYPGGQVVQGSRQRPGCPQRSGREGERVHRVALRYVFPQEMESLLFYNGFRILSCYGNWRQEPLTANSPAMIYICQRRH